MDGKENIMNAATIFGTILSLLLAAATAGSTTGPNAPASDRPAPPGVNLNHNETFVRDVTDNRTPNAWSRGSRRSKRLWSQPFLRPFATVGSTCACRIAPTLALK